MAFHGAAGMGDGYDASAIEVLRGLDPVRRRPDGFVTGDPLSKEACAILRLWHGREDETLNAVADVALPLSKVLNRSVLNGINELFDDGCLERAGGLRLTDLGKAYLEIVGPAEPVGPGARE